MVRLWFVVWFLGVCVAAQAQTPADKRAAADHLLDALKAAPDETAAAMLEEQLQQTWLRAGSPAVTLLMSRGLRSMHAGQDDEATVSFSDAITLQPAAGAHGELTGILLVRAYLESQGNPRKKILVPDDVPIVSLEPSDRSLLQAGAHVIVVPTKGADGMLTASRISVGENGTVPPM